MKMNRTKNAVRNMIFGIILKLYQIVLPFAFRSLMLYTLGIQYLGLNSMFTSILQVLNLAELGVGSALVFSMYKPIAEDDKTTICALMRLYKIYYRIIGAGVLILGLILIPVLPYLVKSELPADVNLYVLYLLNLSATVLSYWLFAYKNSVLIAHQRVDISSKITILTSTCQYVLQAISLTAFHNYYYYMICSLLIQVTTNIVTALAANKMFPQYQAYGTLPREEVKKINQRVKDLFTSKLGGTIVNSSDTLVISAFLGLEMLAIYQNYFYIMNSVMAFLMIIYQSLTAGLGNSLLTKKNDENYHDFITLTFLIFWVFGICICCFLNLYQPFMIIWMGKEMLLPNSIVVLLCIYFLGYELVMFLSLYKDAGGVWHKDRFRPLISGILNLILNLCLVNFIGIYGILLSTIISVYLVSAPWIIHNVLTIIFKKCEREYYRILLKYSLAILLAVCATYILCSFINLGNIMTLILRILICGIIPNILFYLMFRKTNEFRKSVQIIKRILPGKVRSMLKMG